MNLKNYIIYFIKNFIMAFQFLFGANKVLVIGDSHVNVFNHWRIWLKDLKNIYLMCAVPGATASGLSNPASKTQAYKIFSNSLSSKKYDEIIVMLGEIDTGFVIWYRAKKYNEDINQMFNQAIKRYSDFIYRCSKFAKVTVISTPLPTIRDNELNGDVAFQRQEVKISQIERTKMTLRFNSKISEFCSNNKFKFISLDQESLGENGLIDESLRSKNPKDHHYNQKLYADLILKKIK